MSEKQHKYVIEHMEPEFSDWVKLEYLQIQRDVGKSNFYISSVPADVKESDLPKEFIDAGLQWTHTEITNFQSVDPTFPSDSSRICLLDPSATEELSPEDADKFDFFLFGGILGDHPPRDRTGELRKYGYTSRNLGKKQMTTDTAVRVTKIICTEKKKLDEIDSVDYPELKFNKHESTEMPFRYVVEPGTQKPILPEGMFELIKEDSKRSLDDLI